MYYEWRAHKTTVQGGSIGNQLKIAIAINQFWNTTMVWLLVVGIILAVASKNCSQINCRFSPRVFSQDLFSDTDFMGLSLRLNLIFLFWTGIFPQNAFCLHCNCAARRLGYGRGSSSSIMCWHYRTNFNLIQSLSFSRAITPTIWQHLDYNILAYNCHTIRRNATAPPAILT